MEMSPQRVRSAEFKTVRKGADLDEVRRFLNDVADEFERAQNQSTAMEARARAAVARLQEVSDGQAATAAAARAHRVDEPVDGARRPVRDDQPHAGAGPAHRRFTDRRGQGRSGAVVAAANGEAATTRDSTREMAATMLDEAREEARRASETERLARGQRGRRPQGTARFPRIRRRPSRAVPRRPARPGPRRGDRTDRDHRPGARRPRRRPSTAAVGIRRRLADDAASAAPGSPVRRRMRRRRRTAVIDAGPTTGIADDRGPTDGRAVIRRSTSTTGLRRTATTADDPTPVGRLPTTRRRPTPSSRNRTTSGSRSATTTATPDRTPDRARRGPADANRHRWPRIVVGSIVACRIPPSTRSRTFLPSKRTCWPFGRRRRRSSVRSSSVTPGRPVTTSSSSTTARRSPTDCRTTATC